LTLLEAAELGRVQLPSSCRNGTCRTCICTLVSGEVRYTVEWPGLSAEEKAEGRFLLGAEFFVEFQEATPTGQRVMVSGLAGRYGPYEAPVFGVHQSENLAVAIAAVEAFLGGGKVPIADDVLRSAVADLSSPGRLQLVRTEPLFCAV
jgi:folylpolyglutamate synthase/dihydropteroate synthase